MATPYDEDPELRRQYVEENPSEKYDKHKVQSRKRKQKKEYKADVAEHPEKYPELEDPESYTNQIRITPEEAERKRKEREKLQKRRGRRASILTSPSGLEDELGFISPQRGATLLGETI
jgi:hypothetical protein